LISNVKSNYHLNQGKVRKLLLRFFGAYLAVVLHIGPAVLEADYDKALYVSYAGMKVK